MPFLAGFGKHLSAPVNMPVCPLHHCTHEATARGPRDDPAQSHSVLVSCAVLPGATERQAILETVTLDTRLRRLIHFLLAEIRTRRKDNLS